MSWYIASYSCRKLRRSNIEPKLEQYAHIQKRFDEQRSGFLCTDKDGGHFSARSDGKIAFGICINIQNESPLGCFVIMIRR